MTKKTQISNEEIQEQGEKFAHTLGELFDGMPAAVIAYGIVRIVNASPMLSREVSEHTARYWHSQQRARLEIESYGPPRGSA